MENIDSKDRMVRRDFIERLARGGFLALIALVTGILFARRQVTLGIDCPGEAICRGCRDLERCTRPEATREREGQRSGGEA